MLHPPACSDSIIIDSLLAAVVYVYQHVSAMMQAHFNLHAAAFYEKSYLFFIQMAFFMTISHKKTDSSQNYSGNRLFLSVYPLLIKAPGFFGYSIVTESYSKSCGASCVVQLHLPCKVGMDFSSKTEFLASIFSTMLSFLFERVGPIGI